jgi:hypothetical protein
VSRRSRRSERRRDRGGAGGEPGGHDRQASGRVGEAAASASGKGGEGASGWGLGVQIGFLVAVFGVVVLVAELAGAANLGVALGIGQIAFAIAVVYLLLRR